MSLQQVLYTARATATGGRDGAATSDDGRLNVKLSVPKGLGGDDGAGTNPEQLFAAGYAACFDSALAFVAAQKKLTPGATQVDATVGIGPNGTGGFSLAVRLEVTIPGLEREAAQALIEATHLVCPYSNALRGNVEVELVLK